MNSTNYSTEIADQLNQNDMLSAVRLLEERFQTFNQTTLGTNHGDTKTENAEQAQLQFQQGIALQKEGKKEEAIPFLTGAITLEPENQTYLLAYGQLEYELGHLDKASDCFEKLSNLDPLNSSNWLTLGFIHFQQGKYQESLYPLSEALSLDVASPDSTFYLAESLRMLQRYEESIPLYQRLLPIAMERPRVAYGYALSLLALGRLEEGWPAFEFRRVCKIGTWQQHNLLNWNGVATANSTILAYSEEGTAADIMFASCLPDLLQSFAEQGGKCIIECDESLHPLFARSFPGATFSPLSPFSLEPSGRSNVFDDVSELIEKERVQRMRPLDRAFFETDIPKERHPLSDEEIDYQIALGSLPMFFRKSFSEFPTRQSFLIPDQEISEKWSQTLAALGSRPKIGFLWQGTFTAESEQQRTIPLESLRSVLSLGKRTTGKKVNVDWISLQQGSKSAELSRFQSDWRLKIASYPEVFKYNRIDELAGLLSSLDLVISPPGYVANLAAALGTPTWLILPSPCDWRWAFEEETSPWFPQMRLFKQRHGEPFQELIVRLLQAFETHDFR